MLHLILVEAELELIPGEVQRHPFIRAYARKRRKEPSGCLLDSSIHHSAMRGLATPERRGRPDIVYIALLHLLGSIANLEGALRVYVHTRNGEMIFISPEARLPRNYNRFVGLMEQLLERGKAGGLLQLKEMSPRELVENLSPERTILLDEGGTPLGYEELKLGLEGEVCAVVGVFPCGSFREDYAFVDEKINIYPKPLEAWAVASKVVCLYEVSLVKER
jgi:rRNA small subunit pseudouridine methyltransferase Nep1